MSGHDHDVDVDVRQHELRAGGHPEEHHYRPNYLQASKQIDDILNGTGDPHDLPQLVSFVTKDELKKSYLQKLAQFEKVPGDISIVCAVELGADVTAVLGTALRSHPKVTASGLRDYLSTAVTNSSLAKQFANVDAALVTQLREQLPGPFTAEIPVILSSLSGIESNGPLVRWFVETSPAPLCANIFGEAMTPALVNTLDHEKLWSWVDAARSIDMKDALVALVPSIQDPHARARLESLANGRAGMSQEAYYADRDKHDPEMHALIAGKPTLQALLDTAARAHEVSTKDYPAFIAELRRLKPSADDVLALSTLSGMHAEDLLALLLTAQGVTAQHVTTFLFRSFAVDILANAKTRATVRTLAPQLRLTELVAFGPNLHDLILTNAGLLDWFLETAHPRDLFWLCTIDPATAGKATRLVQAKAGFDWVHQLPAQDPFDDNQMRVLALNCHDAATATYIREHLLGEAKFEDKVSTRGSLPTDPQTQHHEVLRLVDAIGDAGTPEEVVARVRDLDDARRAKFGKDEVVVAAIASKLPGDDFARVARLLDITAAMTIAHSPSSSPMLADYIVSRPHTEQVAVLAQSNLVRLAADKVYRNLLVVFPALGDPKVLAEALRRDGGILELLLAGSDPNRVASLVGTEPARSAATPILEANPNLVKKLPHYSDMSAAGKRGVDELEGAVAEHSKAHARLEHERHDDLVDEPGARSQGRRLAEARATNTLVDAIDALAGQHERAQSVIDNDHGDYLGHEGKQAKERAIDETNALAVLDEHRLEVPTLLTDRTLYPSVKKLADATGLPPNLAIPWIDAAELARMPNAAKWWMAYRDPLAFLHQLADNKQAQLLVAGGLNTGTMGALEWLERMKKGFELDSVEDRVTDQLRPLMREPAALQALFHVRFGVPPPPEYSVQMMNGLWNVIGRLPPSHLKQERISSINKAELGPMVAGQYVPGDHRIDIGNDVEPGKQNQTFYPELTEGWYTRAKLQQVYGYDDAKFDQLLAQSRFDTQMVGTEQQFRLKTQDFDKFTQVVLHEVGHSVDDILGGRTPPVWDFAGWRAYSDATFDEWAAEMGGWEHVTADDRVRIREAWIEASRGAGAASTVKNLVSPEHPAMSETYDKAGVQIVKAARAGKTFNHVNRDKVGDRVFVAGSYVNSWYSCKASAAEVAPSIYSMYAPMEYFAESYVEYYRNVDGTPGSQAKKGGALAASVRQWFDENVDKLKYDPQRFQGGASEDDPVVNPPETAQGSTAKGNTTKPA